MVTMKKSPPGDFFIVKAGYAEKLSHFKNRE